MEESEFRRKEIKGINIREEKRQLFKDTKEGIKFTDTVKLGILGAKS